MDAEESSSRTSLKSGQKVAAVHLGSFQEEWEREERKRS